MPVDFYNMWKFEYFLYENFDPDKEAFNPDNPRSFSEEQMDLLINAAVERQLTYQEGCRSFGHQKIKKMICAGIFRRGSNMLYIDSPVFLKEDAPLLHKEVSEHAKKLTDILISHIPEIRKAAAEIHNGFPPEVNLYHVMCGEILDGAFFDVLCRYGVLATDRIHPLGLNYLWIIYEKCEALRDLSDEMLCSYNRYADETCSLQSFGDAMGDRLDFYRFARYYEKGNVPKQFAQAAGIADAMGGMFCKETVLSEIGKLVMTGKCDSRVIKLLELFGYFRDGKIIVPIYRSNDRKIIQNIEKIIADCLGESAAEMLTEMADHMPITSVRNGVSRKEIANELYHLLFGTMNEELTVRGIVCAPALHADGGRYMQCIVCN